MRSRKFALKGNRRLLFGVLVLVSVLYFLTRTANITQMNAYTDYDEGTYLLIARLINGGYLPYRDIYAVHPPFYYYALALWLRLFGDSYLVGRLFSLLIGYVSIFLAYLVGRELLDEKLGVLFSLLLVMDPLLIYMNSWVYHETLIELFTLVSLYYFIRYFKSGYLRWGYFSLLAAAIGTTVKFTLIPYLVALYLTILSLEIPTVRTRMKSAVDVLLSSKSIAALAATYAFVSIIVVAATVFSPNALLKELLIVPGVHPITLVDHKYVVSVFILAWLLFVVYLYNVSYVSSLAEALLAVLRNWKLAVKLSLPVFFGKCLIELPLGLCVAGREYLSQTYFTQGGRYIPFVNFFNVVHKFLSELGGNRPDLLVFWLPVMVVVFLALILFTKGLASVKLEGLKSLLLLNIAAYLFVFPIIPGVRFIYPLILLVYLMALYSLLTANVSAKTLASYVLVAVLILGAADWGMVTWYPKNKLDLIWGVHTKELRDDLSSYLRHDDALGKCLSINPMDAYYLNLTVLPFTVDTFGIGYLSGLPPRFLLNYSLSHGVSCVVYDTWAYEIMKRSLRLRRAYSAIMNYSYVHGGEVFSESFSDGERIDLFILRRPGAGPLELSTDHGSFAILVNGSKAGVFWYGPVMSSGSRGCSAELLWRANQARYRLIQVCGGRRAEGTAELTSGGMYMQSVTPNVTFVFNFSKPIVSGNMTLILGARRCSTVYVVLAENLLLEVHSDARGLLVENGTIKVNGPVHVRLLTSSPP